MIHVSKLYCGAESPGDRLRYGQGPASDRPAPAAPDRRPVVVWNITRRCNLRCLHCYSESEPQAYHGELTTAQCRRVIDDLADFGVPVLLFSGGEPLTRKDLLELAGWAGQKGIRPVLSTNGTLIDRARAGDIRAAGFSYVGVSLDGIGEVNDHFRGRAGAFEMAMAAVDHLASAGQRVGLRMTLTRHNVQHLGAIFDLVEQRGIQRVCLYHLAYSGRGRDLAGAGLDLTAAETRAAVDTICRRARDFHDRNRSIEVLTVDNHADGPYLYLKLLDEDPAQAERARQLLEYNGGGLYSTGVGIGCIDWHGQVHPDQFWLHYSLGSVLRRPFGEIWQDTSDPLMAGLKDKASRLHGRCAAGACRFFRMCGGSLRVRAEQATGDPWAPDPACYLTDGEIGVEEQPVRR